MTIVAVNDIEPEPAVEDDSPIDPENIYELPAPSTPNTRGPIWYGDFRGKGTPLIIDNGSSTFRYGYSRFGGPFDSPNVISKFRERKSNKNIILFGEGIELDSTARAQARYPWEGDVLLNFDALENALDAAFIHLGIDTAVVEHPIIMTERLCSPLHSRALTSELIFELYSAPSLTLCVDSLMSFYNHKAPPAPAAYSSDGLVLSFNTASTSVIPILDGKGILSKAKRIPWGGSQAIDYLMKRIQVKYPSFPTRITHSHASWMFREVCEFATDYKSLLRSLTNPHNMRSAERVIQFPFTARIEYEKKEEELTRIAERRKEQGRKLQEIAAQKRLEKLMQKENDLQRLTELQSAKDSDDKEAWNSKVTAEGYENETALEAAIKKLEKELRIARRKEAGEIEDDAVEEPSFPLVDTPDEELDDEGLKEKRKQKMLKAGYEARMRVKREKEREREEKLAEEQREEEERLQDPVAWVKKIREEHQETMSRVKDRKRRKAEMSDRKSAAAQARMKSIADLAADDRVSTKKRRRGQGAEDNFGADDADWAIYRKINTAAPSSDEEEDLQHLEVVEQKLLKHDPEFNWHKTYSAISTKRSALLSAFKPLYDDPEGNARIHLNVERWQACETWFSPQMAGVDSAGLGEVVQIVLSQFSDAEVGRMAKNIFLAGSPSQIEGLVPRIEATLRPLLRPEMEMSVSRAPYPEDDAWRGMRKFALTEEFAKVGVTKAEYDEWGGERIKRWWGGNWNASFVG